MHFEWNSIKARKSFRKHGIIFEEASSAFHDPLAVTTDPDHPKGEEKMVTWNVLVEPAFGCGAHRAR